VTLAISTATSLVDWMRVLDHQEALLKERVCQFDAISKLRKRQHPDFHILWIGAQQCLKRRAASWVKLEWRQLVGEVHPGVVSHAVPLLDALLPSPRNKWVVPKKRERECLLIPQIKF
jgi:hypothetical protein